MMVEERRIEEYAATLSCFFDVSEILLNKYLTELRDDKVFLDSINASISNVADFGGKQFASPFEMRVYRTLLYLITRIKKPKVFIETGVQNGMSSAFILLGLYHNDVGKLFSIDLPPLDQRILAQGTRPLPDEKSPGWIIPDYLRGRHDLCLGRAEVVLPALLSELGQVDVFVHDSDHSYSHIMFESALSWSYLVPGGALVVDNIEQNEAFADFSKGVEATHIVVSTFDGPERRWQHGVAIKADK